eukprot:4086154-Alexandrium_andersonii.AAC.1
MSASLVGSEMCIRDSADPSREHARKTHEPLEGPSARTGTLRPGDVCRAPVSYTHLTLPTICSV